MIDELDGLEDVLGGLEITTDLGEIEELIEPTETQEVTPVDDVIVPDSEEDFVAKTKDITPETDEDEPEITEDHIHATFETVVKGLQKLGNFPDVPEGTKFTEEKFLELYTDFNKQNAVSEIEYILSSKHGQEGLDLFNDVFVKGAPIKDYLSKYQEERDIEALEIKDNIYNQKSVIREYLSSIDWAESDIEDNIETLLESNKLESMSEKYKAKLVASRKVSRAQMAQEAEQRSLQAKQQKEKRVSELTNAVTEGIKAKQINGIPLSVEDSKTLLSYITEDAYRLPNGMPITEFDKDYLELKKDPVKFAALAKLVKDGLNVAAIKITGAEELAKNTFEFKNRTKGNTTKPSNIGFYELLTNTKK